MSGTIQACLNVLLFDMSADDALSKPRFHHQWHPDMLQLEPALMNVASIKDRLASFGHVVKEREVVASVQLIRACKEGWQAGSDPRKGGIPAGY
jgi:gamma-glutamyltranspeptidase/glutathione hydrolase